MNRVLLLGKSQCQVLIISRHYEEIRNAFLSGLDKGVTMYLIETGYNREPQKALCSIVSQGDLSGIQAAIIAIDPRAFMIVSKVQEVRGLGFCASCPGKACFPGASPPVFHIRIMKKHRHISIRICLRPFI